MNSNRMLIEDYRR